MLDRFHPAVSSWFRERFGEPTPPQRLGWPAIASGQNCLIVAPTGSGKTLAAFLAALDHLWTTPRPKAGVRILYISPLKALNQDIWRNLQVPLEEIQARSREMGNPLPVLAGGGAERRYAESRAGGDGSQAARHLDHDAGIAAPDADEPGAGDPSRGLACDRRRDPRRLPEQARGVPGALARAARGDQSRELRPDRAVGHAEAARRSCAVSGWDLSGRQARPRGRGPGFRPVTIVDAGWRRDLDLEVIWPRTLGRQIVAGTIWPEIEERLLVAGRRASVDDHLRQQSADRRKADFAAERTGRSACATPR